MTGFYNCQKPKFDLFPENTLNGQNNFSTDKMPIKILTVIARYKQVKREEKSLIVMVVIYTIIREVSSICI